MPLGFLGGRCISALSTAVTDSVHRCAVAPGACASGTSSSTLAATLTRSLTVPSAELFSFAFSF